MFYIKSKNNYIDIHSHILPGIDDGSYSAETTAMMLSMAADSGIRKIIATPHYKSGRKTAPPNVVKSLTENLRNTVKALNIPIKLYSGNEIYYKQEIVDLLEKGKILTLAGSSCVLIEFAPDTHFSYIRNAVDNVKGNGYIPVIAHVERCDTLLRHMDRVENLKRAGALMQMNSGSIMGQSGQNVKYGCKKMLKDRLIDFVATDAHSNMGKRIPQLHRCGAYLRLKCGDAYAERILHDNADEIILSEVRTR